MLSRRNFLKLAGLGSIAVSAGYMSGKIINSKDSEYFVMHGFIPSDENIINNILLSFRYKIKSNVNPTVIADSKIGEVITRLDSYSFPKSFGRKGKVVYRIKRLNETVDSDIIISDASNSLYSLDDFNTSLFELRKKIRETKADYLFTAEYRNDNLFSTLLKSNKKELVIENEKGIVDIIPLEKNYNNIIINGVQGRTGLIIQNGIARVNTSSCRNGICKHSLAAERGNIIACAPNKVLIKVV